MALDIQCGNSRLCFSNKDEKEALIFLKQYTNLISTCNWEKLFKTFMDYTNENPISRFA